MRVLHTSDWHLGNSFHERKRTREFESFLNWLLELMDKERIDVLLVSGDIFDNGAPGTQALELYYNFLGTIAETGRRNVVIVAGNHDSPSLLNAPRLVFRNLNIHVVGSVTPDPADEVLVLEDESGTPAMIICAVPYLRDRDVRRVAAGERIEEKVRNLQAGIRDHYHRVQEIAASRRSAIGRSIPLVVMGHLYVTGGHITDDDKVRELYLGTLLGVGPDTFLPEIDYLALGHLHKPQTIQGLDSWRYSGAPLPMEFSDTFQQKQVVIVEFEPGHSPLVREIDIPCFQEMERVRGTLPEIEQRIRSLVTAGKPIWIEVVLDDSAIIPDLPGKLTGMVRGSNVEILGIVNHRLGWHLPDEADAGETLDELSETEVFGRCLQVHQVEGRERPELMALFCEILDEITTGSYQGEES